MNKNQRVLCFGTILLPPLLWVTVSIQTANFHSHIVTIGYTGSSVFTLEKPLGFQFLQGRCISWHLTNSISATFYGFMYFDMIKWENAVVVVNVILHYLHLNICIITVVIILATLLTFVKLNVHWTLSYGLIFNLASQIQLHWCILSTVLNVSSHVIDRGIWNCLNLGWISNSP